jgi:hypothetical protein
MQKLLPNQLLSGLQKRMKRSKEMKPQKKKKKKAEGIEERKERVTNSGVVDSPT